ncbi:MAG: cytochrome C, partial [Lentisphaeraceae bacterium]|nr:cytochrome C [Lentisphaeraceae bacterium]
MKLIKIALLALGIVLSAPAAQPSNKAGWWETYDYGQVSSQVLSYKKDKVILRGQAVKLDFNDQKITAYYDTGDMNLRYVALAAMSFNGTPWNGSHGGNSQVQGELFFSNSPSLAWAYKGSWEDPRQFPYAPLSGEYIKFKGTHRSNDKVIYSYTVGDAATLVYERPLMIKVNGHYTFLRQFTIPQTKQELLLKVIDNQSLQIGSDLFLQTSKFSIEKNDAGIHFIRIPAGSKNLSFTLSYSKAKFAANAQVNDLRSFLRGGRLRWPQTIDMQGTLNAHETSSFAVDQIPVPQVNPWGSKIRFGG